MRATSHDRLAAETGEEREARLQQMRDRLASETAVEKESRLQQMSVQQRDRLASETAKEKESKLQQMSAQQHDRLASETAEERDIRLQCYSVRHREQIVVLSQLPLFEQRSVRTKMLGFHAHMASLDSPQCTTLLLKMFPGASGGMCYSAS